MNKKGFTLAEILGVIVIIALLLLLIIPAIVNRITDSGDEATEAGNKIIFDASDNYIDENVSGDKTGTYCIPIKDLINDGKLVEPVLDVKTGEDISDKSVFVSIKENKDTTYEIMESADCKADSIIYKITFTINPSGTKWVHERNVIISYPKLGNEYQYLYQINDGEWQEANSGNFELPPFREIATVNATMIGTETLYSSTEVKNIDNEIPTINSLTVAKDSKIQIKAIDNVSGINGYYISEKNETPDLNDKNWVKADIKAKKEATFTVPKKQGTYYVWVKDRAGNISSNNNNSITLTNRKVTATFVKDSNVTSINSQSKSCTILAGNTSCNIKLPNIVPNREYVIDGWYNGNTRVGGANETYAISNDITLTGKAKEDVITASLSTTQTTNSITVIANATALSDIVKYEFSIDNGKTWINEKDENNHKFTKLIQGTTYNISVRITSASGKTKIVNKNATTKKIPLPTFSETGRKPKIVTITYPDGCGDEFTCTYRKNNGSEVEVKSKTAKVSFTDDGTIIAKVSDGTNQASSSYNVILYVQATYHAERWYCPSGYTQSGSGSSTSCYKTTTTNATYHRAQSVDYTVEGYCLCPGGKCTEKGCTNPEYSGWDITFLHGGCPIPCQEGDTKTDCTNYCRATKPARYTCSSGTLVGTKCRKTTYTSPYHQNAYYSCPSGYTLRSGTTRCYPD